MSSLSPVAMGRGPACPAHAEDSLPTKESGPPLSARQAPQAVGGRVVGGPRLEEDQPLPPAGGGGARRGSGVLLRHLRGGGRGPRAGGGGGGKGGGRRVET